MPFTSQLIVSAMAAGFLCLFGSLVWVWVYTRAWRPRPDSTSPVARDPAE